MSPSDREAWHVAEEAQCAAMDAELVRREREIAAVHERARAVLVSFGDGVRSI